MVVVCRICVVQRVVPSDRDPIRVRSQGMPKFQDPPVRPTEIVGKNVHFLFGLVFPPDAGRPELTSRYERRRLTNVELLGVDSDWQLPPSATQLGRNCEADDAATNYGNGRLRFAPAHIAHHGLDVFCYHAGAPEAQGNSGAPMPIVVNTQLGSEPAGNRLVLELETDTTLSMGPNTDNKRSGRNSVAKNPGRVIFRPGGDAKALRRQMPGSQPQGYSADSPMP